MKLPVPHNEQERLNSINSYHIVESEQDIRLDDLTKLAANMFDVPIAIITILDQRRQWFKAKYGLDLKESPREISFCQYTIMGNEIFEVADSVQDKRFKENPFVIGEPHIRYYCGAPLRSREGFILGSLGLLDVKPRRLDQRQRKTLALLAAQVVDHFELNRDKKDLETIVAKRTQEIEQRLLELTRKDEKLQAVNTEFNRFMYKASHDLRGPLKTMLGLLNLAMAEDRAEVVKQYLRLLKQTQDKLDRTLDLLLKVVEVKDHKPSIRPIQLPRLLDRCVKKAAAADPLKDPIFDVVFNSEPIVNTDAFLLETALEQVLNNSVKHTDRAQPLIRISITLEEHWLNIVVEDNGKGISDEDKDQLFKMFYQNSDSGSGLGLYTAKTAMDLLEAKISYTSHKSRGTTFSLTIPC